MYCAFGQAEVTPFGNAHIPRCADADKTLPGEHAVTGTRTQSVTNFSQEPVGAQSLQVHVVHEAGFVHDEAVAL